MTGGASVFVTLLMAGRQPAHPLPLSLSVQQPSGEEGWQRIIQAQSMQWVATAGGTHYEEAASSVRRGGPCRQPGGSLLLTEGASTCTCVARLQL